MNYYNFEVGNKTYKLRINTRNVIELEKRIGCNPLAIFGDGETLPTVTVMVNVLHCALQQYQHGISLNDAFDIFDEYIDSGKTAVDFVPEILEVYRVSGLIPNNTETGKN